MTPKKVIATPVPKLRSAGLSERKASYLLDLASHFNDGRLSEDTINAMSATELTETLVKVCFRLPFLLIILELCAP